MIFFFVLKYKPNSTLVRRQGSIPIEVLPYILSWNRDSQLPVPAKLSFSHKIWVKIAELSLHKNAILTYKAVKLMIFDKLIDCH